MSRKPHRAQLRGTATHLLALCKRNNEIREDGRKNGQYWSIAIDWVNLAGEHCRTHSFNDKVINFFERGKRQGQYHGS